MLEPASYCMVLGMRHTHVCGGDLFVSILCFNRVLDTSVPLPKVSLAKGRSVFFTRHRSGRGRSVQTPFNLAVDRNIRSMIKTAHRIYQDLLLIVLFRIWKEQTHTMYIRLEQILFCLYFLTVIKNV